MATFILFRARQDKTRQKNENRANSVQLQLQLPTGTELGKRDD